MTITSVNQQTSDDTERAFLELSLIGEIDKTKLEDHFTDAQTVYVEGIKMLSNGENHVKVCALAPHYDKPRIAYVPIMNVAKDNAPGMPNGQPRSC